MQHFHFETLDSTNETAKRMIASGEIVSDACIVAREQTAGRGTHDRAWISPRDAGVYLSVVLNHVGRISSTTQLLTMICGAACADALHDRIGADVRLKPINDLILGAGKLGGILTEAMIEAGTLKHLIVGVGLNLRINDLSIPKDAMRPAFLESAVPDIGAIDAKALASLLAEKISGAIRGMNPETIEHARLAWDRLSIEPHSWPV